MRKKYVRNTLREAPEKGGPRQVSLKKVNAEQLKICWIFGLILFIRKFIVCYHAKLLRY